MDNYWTTLQRGRLSRRRMLAGTATLGASAAALAAVGCGDDDDSKPASTGTQTVGAQPKRGGHIVYYRASTDQGDHDPHTNGASSEHADGPPIVYSRLLRKKFTNSDYDQIPEGLLAASWEQPDDTTYVFKIRPNIKWNNIAPVNGRQLTAEDVAYSTKRQIDLIVNASFFTGVNKVTAVDPLTLRMELSAPNADLLLSMMSHFNSVVAREAVEVKGDLKNGPYIGASAWLIDEFKPNTVLQVKRNPDYFMKDEFGTQLPYADTMDSLRISDQSTAEAAFRTGRVMNIGSLTTEALNSLMAANPAYQIERSVPIGGGITFTVRADVPPTNDIRVRQAINKMVNRQQIIDVLYDGKNAVLRGWFAAATEAQLLSEEETRKILAYDPAGAKQLAQAAGFTGWAPKLTSNSISITAHQAICELVQAQLKELNVNVTITPTDSAGIQAWFRNHDKEMFLGSAPTGVIGPNAYLFGEVKTGGTKNVANISDPELDRLIDAQAKELKDAGRRAQLLQDLQRKILTLAALMPLVGPLSATVWAPQIRNAGAALEKELFWLDQ